MSVIGSNILAGASGQGGGYNLDKSLRFRQSASAYLNRTLGTPTDSDVWTFSFWIKRGSLGSVQEIITSSNGSSNQCSIQFNSSDQLRILNYIGGAFKTQYVTTQVFRDPSSWYHIVVRQNSSSGFFLYVNGTQVTSFGTATGPDASDWLINQSGRTVNIGREQLGGVNYFDGYLTEVNFIDGQALTPSSFGETSTTTGVWQPKRYAGTYGTNGFYLPFTDNSAATPVGLGKDFSGNTGTTVTGTTTSGSNTMTVASLTGISVGNTVTGLGIPDGTYVTAASVLTVTLSQNATSSNTSVNYTFSGNNWTCNNISLTSGSTYDSMTDVPTLTSATASNFCVINPINNLSSGNIAVSNGNLTTALGVGGAWRQVLGTMGMSSGKWYCEVTCTSGLGTPVASIGLTDSSINISGNTYAGSASTSYGYLSTGIKRNSGSDASYGASYTNGDVIGIAFDADTRALTFYKNGTSQGLAYTVASGLTYMFAISAADGTVTLNANFGQRPFAYTPPTGFVALNTYNLPTPTIGATASSQANKYMDATLYTGNNTGQTITNSGSLQPAMLWIKSRSNTYDHVLADAVRGTSAYLSSNSTAAEGTNSELTSFNSNGFTLGATGSMARNVSGSTYVAWQWAGNGTGVTNTAGSITSTVSANTTSGFSVVNYLGTGSAATVGHGLGVAPKMIIVKDRSSGSNNWGVWHTAFSTAGNTDYVFLNTTGSKGSAGSLNIWNGTTPTSTVFSIGTQGTSNTNGYGYIAYCFAEVAGFSKFTSYTGNGSTDGPFIYCGFKPRYVMIKRTDSTGNWPIADTARSTYNYASQRVNANLSDAEYSNAQIIDINSNGFKIRESGTDWNASGGTYIVMAFAESPFKFSLAR